MLHLTTTATKTTYKNHGIHCDKHVPTSLNHGATEQVKHDVLGQLYRNIRFNRSLAISPKTSKNPLMGDNGLVCNKPPERKLTTVV